MIVCLLFKLNKLLETINYCIVARNYKILKWKQELLDTLANSSWLLESNQGRSRGLRVDVIHLKVDILF